MFGVYICLLSHYRLISHPIELTRCERHVIYIHPKQDITSIDNIRWAPIYVNALSVVHVKIKSGPEGTNHSGPEGKNHKYI